MGFKGFYGHEAVADELQASFASGRFAHGYLFTGPQGCGKKTLARLCAQALLCLGAFKPCYDCTSCKRVQSGQHPDYTELFPEKGKKRIGIEQIRSLISDYLSLKPFEGERRAVLIAGEMTQQAQNALLKTLEEPPLGCVIFITAVNAGSLLPTVRSRVMTYSLAAPDYPACVMALSDKGIAKERAELLSRLTGGSIGAALEMDKDEGFWELRMDIAALFRPTAPGELAGIIRANEDKYERASQALDIAEIILTDALRFQSGAPIFMTDLADTIESIASAFDIKALTRLLDELALSRERLRDAVALKNPWQVILERLLFEIVEVTKGWHR